MSQLGFTLTLARIEAMHLARLVDDFLVLMHEGSSTDDPAMARLAPDAYPDDPSASAEFRHASERPLFDRRASDAAVVSQALTAVGSVDDDADEDEALAAVTIDIGADEVNAWLRTLSALRLVLATRLEITDENTHDPNDPRFGVYDWLGFRLETLIEAADAHGL